MSIARTVGTLVEDIMSEDDEAFGAEEFSDESPETHEDEDSSSEAEDDTVDVAPVPSPTPGPSTTKKVPKAKSSGNKGSVTGKLSTADRKAIVTRVTSEIKAFQVAQSKALDALVSSVSDIISVTNKSMVKPKVIKKVQTSEYPVGDVHPKFMALLPKTWKRSTIQQRDIINAMQLGVFDKEGHLVRTAENYEALNLSKKEVTILSGLDSDTHKLNVGKSDFKTILAKIIKPNVMFKFGGHEFCTESETLWSDLLEAGGILKGKNEKGEMYQCSMSLGESLRNAFGRKPLFTSKQMTPKSFTDYIASVTKKNTRLFFTVPAANRTILEHFDVPYLRLEDNLFTKHSLLKSYFLKKQVILNPETGAKGFDTETLELLSSHCTQLDVGKSTVDDLVTQMSYTILT
uniref:DNA-binding virion core protein I1L n=2 Tax=Retropinna poxvirus TaxID=3064112 RepID=A0AA50ADG3_9POXV|nr:MAG: DNA-binding virion core protein I1L [Retropinna poxvirus]